MSLRQERIAKGLCPNCGSEAAPYYLCGRCRFRELIGRFLRKAAKAGVVKREQRGRQSYWSRLDRAKFDDVDYREATREDDKRLRPRVKGVPVDVEAEIMSIFTRAGKPLTVEEIYAAWGHMRLRSGPKVPPAT